VVTLNLNVDGNPATPIGIEFTNPIPLDISVTSLPKTLPTFDIAVTQLPTITLAPITINPLDVSIRLKEVPSLRITIPVDYRVTFGLCGIELACIHFCGQSQIITEPYVPNPCECGGGIVRG
jgi:hypothetical protein